MPVLKRKVIRPSDYSNVLEIEDSDETAQETETVSVIPIANLLVCNKCGKQLNLRKNTPTTVECSHCGCPEFHTHSKFIIECVECNNIVDVKDNFYGYCVKCKKKMWQII